MKTYTFNSYGFRGEPLRPRAHIKLFVCGCSYSFGTGLDLEESWPHLFKVRLAAEAGVDPSMVNLLNFSQGGGSNDYIVRTLIEQCSQITPTLVIAGFTYLGRFELLGPTSSFFFQPSVMELYEGTKHAEIGKRAQYHLLGSDEIFEQVRAVKNALLLQGYLESRQIPWIFFTFGSLDREDFFAGRRTKTVAPLVRQVDVSRRIPLCPDMVVDRAADGAHPGPRSNKLFADSAWRTYIRSRTSTQPGVANKLSKQSLRATSDRGAVGSK